MKHDFGLGVDMVSLVRFLLFTLGAVAFTAPGQASVIKYPYAYSAYYSPVAIFDNAFYPTKFFADFELNTFGGTLSLRPDYDVSFIKGALRQNGPREITIPIYSMTALQPCDDPVASSYGWLVGATCYSPILSYGFTMLYLTPHGSSCCYAPIRFHRLMFMDEPLFWPADLGIVGVDLPFVPLEPVPLPSSVWFMAQSLLVLVGWAWRVRRRPV